MELAVPAAGFLPTQWALAIEAGVVLFMLAVAARRKKLRRVLTSDGSLIWLGGLMLVTSSFFVNTVFFDPNSFYASLSNDWQFPSVLENLLSLEFIGANMLLMAWVSALIRWRYCKRASWLLTGGLLLASLGRVVWSGVRENLTIQSINGRSDPYWVATSLSMLTIAAIVLVPIRVRDDQRRVLWVHCIFAASVLLIIASAFVISPYWLLAINTRFGFWLQVAAIGMSVTRWPREGKQRQMADAPPYSCRTAEPGTMSPLRGLLGMVRGQPGVSVAAATSTPGY